MTIASQLRILGDTVHDDRHGLTTVYANELAASVAPSEAAHYPNGSVILMEFAEPQRDGEDQLMRDAHGQPLKAFDHAHRRDAAWRRFRRGLRREPRR